MNLITKLAYNALTKTIQAIAPGGVLVALASSEAGAYTPVAVNGTNMAAVTALTGIYSVVGKIVTVSIQCAVDPTSTGAYDFTVSLPKPSNLTAATDVKGLSVRDESTSLVVGYVNADTANDTAKITGYATYTAASNANIMFQYEIK
jgi:hypothetical protein